MANRSHRLTIGLLAALVVVLGLGSAGAVAITAHQRGTAGVAAPLQSVAAASSSSASSMAGRSSSPSRATRSPSTADRTPSKQPGGSSIGSPAAASSPDQSSASPPASSAAAVVDSDPSVAPVGPSNNLTVQMSPQARAHPRSQEVLQLLQSYFDAINQHNYDSWTQTVTSTLASHQSSEQWLQAYASTVDSSIWVQSLRDQPMQVQLRFTSQQDKDLAPKDLQADCIHWAITYQLANQDGQLAVSSTVGGSVTYAKC